MCENGTAFLQQMKTLYEPDDISVLPRSRLKTRQTTLTPAICFYNGSFAPVHGGHVSVLREAKQYIDGLGTHELLAAYMSPSHSGYVARKLPSEEFIGIGHRLAMIHLAIESLDWVMVDLYETFQPNHTPLNTIMHAFMARVRSQLSDGAQIDVFWLKGEDALLFRCPERLTQLGFQSLYVFNRGGGNTPDYREERWQKIRTSCTLPERIHRIAAADLDLSSTAIRACSRNDSTALEQLQLCTQLDSVVAYIRQHHLWCVRENAVCVDTLPDPIFPRYIDNLTPTLLSEMLSKSLKTSVNVTSYQAHRIGERKGWGGPLYRLHNIEYAAACGDLLPQSMVFKISTGVWNGRTASSEPDFYLNIAPRISHVGTPRCFYAARCSNAPEETLLLLEDLSLSCVALPPKHLLDHATVSTLIVMLATVHAEFFEHPLLRSKASTWLPPLASTHSYYQVKYAQRINEGTRSKWSRFNLSLGAEAYINELAADIPRIFETLSNRRCTLTHGDFWLNNVLLRSDQPHRLVLLDWQTCCRANGLIDVVYFLRLLGSKQARSLDPHMLRLYHQTLMRYGISHYTLAQIEEDYYTLALPFMFVFFACWDVHRANKMNEMARILEDILMYSRKLD